jgi:hypothetical protein
MENKLTCMLNDNKFINEALTKAISSVFKNKSEQDGVINLLCDLMNYSSVCSKTEGIDCSQLKQDIFKEILSITGESDISKLIPGLYGYVDNANKYITDYNNIITKGEISTENIVSIINKYINILNNIASFLPLGKDKIVPISKININTITNDCKDAQETILANNRTIESLNSQIKDITTQYNSYKTTHPAECPTIPKCPVVPQCPTCPTVPTCPIVPECPTCPTVPTCPIVPECPTVPKCPVVPQCPTCDCLDVKTDCSNKLSELNDQINDLEATKKNMGIIGIIIVSILGLLLIWLMWNLLIKKRRFV